MINQLSFRSSEANDVASIEALYPAAFPEEDLLPVVRSLLSEAEGVLSLVATSGEELVGNVIFTSCSVDPGGEKVALLAPLAVAPAWQRKGVGSKIVEAGFSALRTKDIAQVFTLGDPAYYGRFGFRPERNVSPPYALPEEWRDGWQSVLLSEVSQPTHGTLAVPAAWRHKSLWLPPE